MPIDRSGEDTTPEVIDTEGNSHPDGDTMPAINPAAPTFDIFKTAREDDGSEEVKSEEDNTEEVQPDKPKGISTPKVATEPEPEDLDKTEPVREVKIEKEVKGRDYSIFDPADVPLMKRMGNEQFNRVKAIYQENKELKSKPKAPERKEGDLPDSYYEHPEAFVLAPQYKQVSAQASLAKDIQTHWKRQELNISKNGKVQDLGWDDKQGKLVYMPEREATAEDAVNVENLLTEAREQTMSTTAKLKEITTNFKNRATSEVNALKQEEERLFPGYGDDKHESQAAQKELLNKLPPSLRSSPLASTLVKAGAALGIVVKAYKEIEAENQRLKGIKKDSQQAPPKKNAFVKSGNSNGKAVDFSIFDKARNESV